MGTPKWMVYDGKKQSKMEETRGLGATPNVSETSFFVAMVSLDGQTVSHRNNEDSAVSWSRRYTSESEALKACRKRRKHTHEANIKASLS